MTKRGFTLIEIMVAVTIFSMVALVATGAVLTANRVNRRVQAIKLVTDNLHFVLENMAYNIKYFETRHCINQASGSINIGTASNKNCGFGDDSNGGEGLLLKDSSGQYALYAFRPTSGEIPGSIKFADETSGGSINLNTLTNQITLPSVEVTDLRFYVDGNQDHPDLPTTEPAAPRVSVVLSARVVDPRNPVEFTLQTTISD
ncbi:MAG: prepilin-type N-terminal cleavage/methylation domain-containing protein [Patescibacteria group bacterium]